MHSYPSIFNLGHRAVADILKGPVVVQEKIDGSQFSFQARCTGNPEGPDYGQELIMKSKGARVFEETTDKLFRPAVDTVLALWHAGKLVEGWTYRGEVLARPKHNTLAYDRVPKGNIILFDVDIGEEAYAIPKYIGQWAEELGLECVPTLFEGVVESLDQVKGFLDRVSVLGGSKIEGVVIKAYGTYGEDKKTLMAKYVSEAFKEVHGGEWRKANPTSGDIILELVERYKTPARWQKAVQHIREAGTLKEAPQDIGPLIKEVGLDVEKEEKDAISASLWAHFWPKIRRGITAGLPEWYKLELAKAAFPAPPLTIEEIADPRPLVIPGTASGKFERDGAA